MVDVLHLTDPGCPWAWSASPAIAALRWRFGDGLRWRHAMIGLTERAEQYEQRGYTPLQSAIGYNTFRRFGMPLSPTVRERLMGTSRGCRAIVATRRLFPEREYAVFRALQGAWFTTDELMDTVEGVRRALATVPGLDVEAIVGRYDSDEVREAYEADRAEARTAEGGATHFQGKHATSDGPVRYTAPSLLLRAQDGRTLEAGGFQSFEAYDVLIANLDQSLTRRAPAENAAEVLEAFPDGLTTAEVALIMTQDKYAPDLNKAEDALIAAIDGESATRLPFGHDALWVPPAPVAVAA